VEGGIAPDLFRANFSPVQLYELLGDETLSDGLKAGLSARVAELLAEYDASEGAPPGDEAIRWLAGHEADPSVVSTVRNTALSPYYALCGFLERLNDKASARALLMAEADPPLPAQPPEIDWGVEEEAAIAEGERASANNAFGMLSDYYTTNIGSRLERFEGRDSELSYSISEEYGDLRLLFEVCKQKNIEPLFVHVPLHGQWSDYTGFTAERRQEYYSNVRAIADEYGVETLDLTGREYEEFFLCDVMHLGWKGWLEVDRAIIEYYHGD
jgi:D-alanine transfer protein